MSDDILRLIHEKVDKLDTKIDNISSDIVEIKVTSARHDENLKLHMKRSDAAEQGINLLKDELIPIKKHVHGVDVVIKLIAIASSVVGSIAAVFKLFGKI